MKVSGTVSAASRRVITAVALAAVLGGSVAVAAQDPGQQTAAPAQQQAPPEEDQFKFERPGRVIILWQVKTAQASNFVLAWQTIKAELEKMGDPALTQLADGINVLRVELPPTAPNQIFLFDIASVSTTHSYNPVALLYETLKESEEKPGVGLDYDRATELFEHIKGSLVDQGISFWPVTEVR
jgi:hypothetical protein